MASPRIAGAVRLEFPRQGDADVTYDALRSLLTSMVPGDVADRLDVLQRGRIVVFGQPDAVIGLLGPVRAVPR